MTMPCPLVGRTKLSHRIWYFFIWSFVAAHVTCSNSEWGYRVFYGPREHPNIFQGTGQHWLIFQENKGINLILGDRKVAIWKSMHWPYAFVIVHRQSHCFDALLIIKRMLMSEKLTQAGRTNIAIYAPNLRYVLCTQIPTILYAHGEWECLQSKFVNCCHTMS